MNKELEALLNDVDTLHSFIINSRISKELKGWAYSSYQDLKTDIKQALKDKGKHIKELQSKLNAIEEVCNKDNVKSPDKLWEIENILRSVEDEV